MTKKNEHALFSLHIKLEEGGCLETLCFLCVRVLLLYVLYVCSFVCVRVLVVHEEEAAAADASPSCSPLGR